MECKKMPIIIPVYIHDLESVLLSKPPYLSLSKNYTVTYGNPIQIESLFEKWERLRQNPKDLAKANLITSLDNLDYSITHEQNSFSSSKNEKDATPISYQQSEQFIHDRLKKSLNKSYSIVPTCINPKNYLNPILHEDGKEHFLITEKHVLRAQFTEILRRGLISLKKETIDWLENQKKEGKTVHKRGINVIHEE